MKKTKQNNISEKTFYIIIIISIILISSLIVYASSYVNPTTKVGHDLSEINLTISCPSNNFIRGFYSNGTVVCEPDSTQYDSSTYSFVRFSVSGSWIGYFIINGQWATASCTCFGSDTCTARSQISGGTIQVRALRTGSSPCDSNWVSGSSASCGVVTANSNYKGVGLIVTGEPSCSINGYW